MDQKEWNIDWTRVKAQTLWSFEDLIKMLLSVLAYDFVQRHYNHTLNQALRYALSIRRGYLQERGDMAAHIDRIASYIEDLERRWSGSYSDLVRQIETRGQCLAFLQDTGFEFDQLIQLLNYLLRWVLPFKAPLREFIDTGSNVDVKMLEGLREQGIKSNLDLLEAGCTAAGRQQLANKLELPVSQILALVHRADISRLAYVRGKTVRHLCGAGYDTLEKIASADVAEIEVKMGAYYETLGKTLADFKAVIPLPWMIGGAQTLPRGVV